MCVDNVYRPPDRDKYLLAEEIKSLLEAAKRLGDFQYQYLTFMANTGVRPSEAKEVAPNDVYPTEHRVHVRTLKQKPNKEGKIREVFRDVDLSPDFTTELMRWIGPRVGRPEKLFPISRVTMWKTFKKAAHLAKLPPTYTLYSLRHSRAIYLLEWTEGDLDYVSRQLGHSSINITKVYLHCLPSKREDYIKSRLGTF